MVHGDDEKCMKIEVKQRKTVQKDTKTQKSLYVKIEVFGQSNVFNDLHTRPPY